MEEYQPDNIDYWRIKRCRRCGKDFQKRLQRHRFVKYLFSFLPLRRYYCARCQTSRYIWGQRKTLKSA